MNGFGIEGGSAVQATKAFLRSALRLFGVKGKEQESLIEQRIEEYGRMAYQDIRLVNFSEIFSTRLANYVLSGSTVSTEDEEVGRLVDMAFEQANKWCPMAFGVGRVYLVPRANDPYVMVDIIDQSRVIDTKLIGAQTFGFVCESDVRMIGNKKYTRITYHDYNPQTKTYIVKQKALNQSGAEVPLAAVPEWAEMQDYIFNGVERTPFGVVDSPKDNRSADNAQGAPIIYGCGQTIREIWETIDQYKREYENKQSILGVDTSVLDTTRSADNRVALPRTYVRAMNTRPLASDGGDLFSVYSPEIRSEAYKARLLELFGRLEKQVGTSSGILTPADTSMATATQVRRAMYDTWAMVDRMRKNIEKAFDDLTYGLVIMQNILGGSLPTENTLTWDWSQGMVKDSGEEFQQFAQAHSAGVVSDAELRRQVYPSETKEEAEKAVEEIKANRPDMGFGMFENFGNEGNEDEERNNQNEPNRE